MYSVRRNYQNYLLVIFAAVLLIIVIAVGFIGINTKSSSITSQTPSVIPLSPTPTQIIDNPPVNFNSDAQKKLIEKVKDRLPVTTDDTQAIKKILGLLPSGYQSGVIYQSPNVIIEYVHAPNVFQAEILTTDIKAAKEEANIWFRQKGLSQQAICNYPVMFYLNWEAANKLRDRNIIFSPLPEGCQ